MLDDILGFVAASSLATALKASSLAYPIVNAVHIMGLATVFGAILALDLRLLGVARAVPVHPLAAWLPRVAAGGLCVAVLTGLLLFSVKPFDYVANRAFLVKVALVAAGTLHALVVHASSSWRRLVSGSEQIDGRIRSSAALSLTLWIAAILAGRFIAF